MWHNKTHEAKNVTKDEFDSISGMLGSLKWDLPECEEYKNDIPLPRFLPAAAAASLTAGGAPPPAFAIISKDDAAVSEAEWLKVDSMVASMSCLG